MNKRWISIMTASIILSACANHEQPNRDPNRNNSSNLVAEATEKLDQHTDIQTEVDESPSSDVSEQPSLPAEQEPLYFINDIYDVKAIDESDEKIVLLTFDDGPKDEEMISQLLETLAKHDAKALFFVNGYRVEQNPDLLQLIYDEGHTIGNHSWDHINLTKESKEVVDQQIEDVQQAVKTIVGEAPQFFRAPFGANNEIVREKVAEEGMLYMNWSNGSLDWDSSSQTPEAVIENVENQLRSGSNILMHELPWTVEALDTLLTRLEEQNYHFVDPALIDITYAKESQ